MVQKTRWFGSKALVLELPLYSASFMSRVLLKISSLYSLPSHEKQRLQLFLLSCPPSCSSRKFPRSADPTTWLNFIFSLCPFCHCHTWILGTIPQRLLWWPPYLLVWLPPISSHSGSGSYCCYKLFLEINLTMSRSSTFSIRLIKMEPLPT